MMVNSRQMPQWRDILDVPVAALGFAEAAALVGDALARRSFLRVNFLNANNANITRDHPALGAVLARSVVLSDGAGLNLASRLLYGTPFPANLNGTDFVPRLLRQLPQGLKIGMVGATAEVLAAARANFARLAPQLEFVAIADGFFAEDANGAIAAKVAAARPDLLMVAMGTPRQEIWADQMIDARHCTVVITVGALFDFIAMQVPRAPMVMRRFGVEWMFRLMLEPRRLFRRYVVGNPLFVGRVLIQKFTRRPPVDTLRHG